MEERKNYIKGKVILITGSGGKRGFGSAAAEKLAARGGRLVICGRNPENVEATVRRIREQGGEAIGVPADVSRYEDNKRLVHTALEHYGGLDVFVANAGIMPLAFWSDAETAMDRWNECIDTNYKGVVYGISASREALEQRRGQFIVLSSIYANTPVTGAAVYQSTKIAVRYLVETLRQEEYGRIRTTIINPTGVPATNLMKSVVNHSTYGGGMGAHILEFRKRCEEERAGTGVADPRDEESPDCYLLSPATVADSIVQAIDLPAGVSFSEITVRATNELFCM